VNGHKRGLGLITVSWSVYDFPALAACKGGPAAHLAVYWTM
jgi:hypothetical protein